jgi:hypothetical protein
MKNGLILKYRLRKVILDVDPLLSTYKLLELRGRLNLRSEFILIHPDYVDRYVGRNYLRKNIKKELEKMNLSIDDIGNLRNYQNVLSELCPSKMCRT